MLLVIPGITPTHSHDPILPAREPAPVSLKIDFARLIEPLTNLITRMGLSIVWASMSVIHYHFRILTAAQVVFSRLFTTPSFNPYEPAFKEMLDHLEQKAAILQENICNLDQKFWQKHLIVREIKDFKQSNFEVDHTLDQLGSYTWVLNQRLHRLPVQDQLDQVKKAYEDLEKQMNDYCVRKGMAIFEEFADVLHTFTQGGIDLPVEIRNDLIQTWKNLDAVLKPRFYELSKKNPDLYNKKREVEDQVRFLKKKLSTEQKVGLVEPLKLSNIGNSCYIDSVLQALLCVGQVCEQFNESIPRGKLKIEEYTKKLAIQQEILQFINVKQIDHQTKGPLTQMELVLFLLGGGPSLKRLRNTIFESGLHHEFADKKDLYAQLDAASLMELLVDEFLPNCHFKIQECTTTEIFPDLEFKGRVETMTVLQLPLRNRYKKISDLLRFSLAKHIERQDRRFDPKAGKALKEEAADLFKYAPETPTKEYTQWYQFTDLPPVMTLHFKRFVNKAKPDQIPRLEKDNRPVELPADGIVDLTKYYDASEGDLKRALYKVKSYVYHTGSYQAGHYMTNLELNGHYYHCDDTSSKCYKPITKKEFLSHQDPYLVVLERLSDEEID